MGQLNLPVLNRVGYKMYWNSVWDSCYSYRKEFNKNFFLKAVLMLLLSDRLLYGSFFLSKKFNFFLDKKKLNFSNFTINSSEEFMELAKKNIPCFYSRIWYIKYQSWVLITLFIYSAKVQRQKFFKKNIFKKNKIYFCYYNYLYFLKNNFNNKYNILADNTDKFY